MPMTASSDSTMIWATAKLTDVSSAQIARPRRAAGFGSAGRARAARVTAGLEMVALLDRRGRSLGDRSTGSLEPRPEVGLQVLQILEPHRCPEEAGGNHGLGQSSVIQLAMSRGGRVDDHREDAPE